jgi:hypothetical protein
VKHPYEKIGDYARWDRAFADIDPREVDLVGSFQIRLTRDQPIVTAGSCFAQHIARYLRDNGFNYLVTERGHPLLGDDLRAEFNYGVFSARYGNVYTSRQLEQLFRRAYGTFIPVDGIWDGEEGFVDPFRPTIQPGGFPTERELELDREQHFACVRKAFEELDVLIFTFGLTECWAARADGAVFPLAPGVAGGVYEPERYTFLNLSVDEVVSDMRAFIANLRDVNPNAQVILTVSPVPLFATAVDRHVLVSTTYSKSVLRVAAEELVQSLDGVHYFPSYEIVTGNFSRGAYFADDLRSIREAGVEHVMSLFFEHATESTAAGGPRKGAGKAAAEEEAAAQAFQKEMEELVDVLCDEELIGATAANGSEPDEETKPKAAKRKQAAARPGERRKKRSKAQRQSEKIARRDARDA